MKRLNIGIMLSAVAILSAACGGRASTVETSETIQSTAESETETSTSISESKVPEKDSTSETENREESKAVSAESGEDSKDTSAESGENSDKPEEIDDHRLLDYAVVYGEYRKALEEGWSGEKLIAADISLICEDVTDPINTLGYAFYDFDNDGVDEFVVGYCGEDEDYKGLILDLYTLVDGIETHVFSSSQRDRYYITDLTEDQDYAFYRLGFSGANMFDYEAYLLDGGQMKCSQAVRYDGNDADPWKMGWEENGEVVYPQVIDEETGTAIIDSAENNLVQLSFTSFAD